MTTRGLVAAVWLGLSLVPVAASGFQNERAGFERLDFGQSIDAVRKVYPTVRLLDREEFGAIVVYSPFIQRYHVPEVRLAGMPHPVSFELRFWKEKLWMVIVYFGDNTRDDIIAQLTKRYGEPKPTKPDPSWVGTIAAVTMSAKQKWFGVNDQAMSAEIRTLLMAQMHQPTPLPRTPASTEPAGPTRPPEAPPTAAK